jgi:hypothetical protein
MISTSAMGRDGDSRATSPPSCTGSFPWRIGASKLLATMGAGLDSGSVHAPPEECNAKNLSPYHNQPKHFTVVAFKPHERPNAGHTKKHNKADCDGGPTGPFAKISQPCSKHLELLPLSRTVALPPDLPMREPESSHLDSVASRRSVHA